MIRRLLGKRCGPRVAPLLLHALAVCLLPVALVQAVDAARRTEPPMRTTRTVPPGLVAALARSGLAEPSAALGQQAELSAGDGEQLELFGLSVALSGDGSTALIAAYPHNRPAGAVYVFVHSGTGWSRQADLFARDAAKLDFFGGSLALSADGGTALVGAAGHNHFTGVTYIFTRSGTNWRQQAELTAGDGAARDQFGGSVALSEDGSTALIGATRHNQLIGAAYVFVRGGTSWRQQAELSAGDAQSFDNFGSSLALSADGNTALVGAIGHNDLTGVAHIFVRRGTSWHQQAELTAGDGAPGDRFGYVTAISGDGSTTLVAAPFRHNRTGSAYLFVRRGTGWHQQAEFTARDGSPGDSFGSVALSGDGYTALVGANGHNHGAGAVSVFVRSGGTWTRRADLTARDGAARDHFGGSVALSSDGRSALVGASFHNHGTGAVYVFAASGVQ